MGQATYTRAGKIASIHIDTGAPGNAFTPETRRQLNAALLEYKRDDDAWIAVLGSSGQDFCVGSGDETPVLGNQQRERSLLWGGGYVEVWKPIIAAVQGECRGEGMAVALGCDLRVGDDSTTFAAGFGQEPGAPDVLAAWLVNLVGLSTTFELLWLDRVLDAKQAFRLGLLNRLAAQGPKKQPDAGDSRFPMLPLETTVCVPDGQAATAAVCLAEELLQYAPVTRNFQKEIAYRSVGVPFHYSMTLEIGPNPYASEDRIEGTRAFVENRRPVWRNR